MAHRGGLTEGELKEWRESLHSMDSDNLKEEWRLIRQAACTPPVNNVIKIDEHREVPVEVAEYSSGTFFQVSQLIRAEMKRRGIAENER